MSFRFAYPWFLAGIPLAIFLAWWLERSRREVFLGFPLQSRLKSLRRAREQSYLFFHRHLLTAMLVLLCLALARPQAGRKQTEVTSQGIDIMLAIDASGSMAAMDFKLEGQPVTRLTVVKKVVSDFIAKQQGDRLGMVIFGDVAYTQSPLTLDYDVLKQLLSHVKIAIAGEGTAIGDGLGLSLKRLKDVPGKSKVVILLTDGRNNAGKLSPEKAAEIAKSLGVKVYTIGIGTQGPVPFPQPGLFGSRLVYVNLDMDLETLQKIAEIAQGRYFFATDTQTLEGIYQEISRLEKTEAKVKHYEIFNELYGYFAWPAVALLALEIFLGATWLRRLA